MLTDQMGLFKKPSIILRKTYESIMAFCRNPLGFGVSLVFLVSLFSALMVSGFRCFSVDYIWGNVSSLWSYLSIDYVVPFIALMATIIALAVPLSYSTLKDISDKYGSYPVRQKFARQWAVRFMPVLLLLVIGWGIGILAFSGESPSSTSKVFVRGYLVLFLVICFAVLSLFKLTRLHSLGSKTLLEQYNEEAKASLKKVKNDSVSLESSFYDNFQETMIGIGDLLAWEAGNTFDPDTVIGGLNNYLDILESFFEIFDRDPHTFMCLSLPQKMHKEILEIWANIENTNQMNRVDALKTLINNPDSLLFMVFSQIGRVYYSSLNFPQEAYRKKQLTAETITGLSDFLLKQAAIQDRTPLLDVVFYRLNQMGKDSISVGKGVLGVDALVLPIVRLLFPQPWPDDGISMRSYRSLGVRWLRKNLFLIAREGDEKTIQILFWYLFHYLAISTAANCREDDYPWSFGFSLTELSGELANELDFLEEQIKWLLTIRELESWENRLETAWANPELQGIVDSGSKKLEALESVFGSMAFNTLLLLMMEFGAYCLFKKRFDLISEFWEFQQPPDASSICCGYDLVPSSVDEILWFFREFSIEERTEVSHIEGHHSLIPYFQEYVVLLLARTLADKMPGRGSSRGNISLSLKYFNPDELRSLRFCAEELIKIPRKLLEKTDLLDTLGFPEDERNFLFGRRV